MKSKSCSSGRSNKALTEYKTEDEAFGAAEVIKKRNNTRLYPYNCEKCGKWHLTPKSRITPSTPCTHCKDSKGKAKESYKTKQGALKRGKILLKEQGVNLSIYDCPHGEGWHLTKKLP